VILAVSLKNLGVVDLEEAADGPGDPEIFDALILLGEDDPSPITEGTAGRVARTAKSAAGASDIATSGAVSLR
jgi:hypothetical protein